MSLYGPKFGLPKIKLPEVKFPLGKKSEMPSDKEYLKPALIVLAVLVVIVLFFIILENTDFQPPEVNFSSAIEYTWKNNPLDLTKKPYENSVLELKLTNNTKELGDISLEILKDSDYLIVDCQEKFFPSVSAGNYRKTICNIMPDPKFPIYAGTYTINIKTNFGEKKATLEIIGK